VQSDGISSNDPVDAINQYLPAGTYFLKVDSTSTGGPGTYTLTATVTQAAAPFQAIPVGSDPRAIVTGDFGNGHLDLAVANEPDSTVSGLLGTADGTSQPQVTYAVGSAPNGTVAGDFTGNGRLDLAVVNLDDDTVSVLLGNGDGTFQPQ